MAPNRPLAIGAATALAATTLLAAGLATRPTAETSAESGSQPTTTQRLNDARALAATDPAAAGRVLRRMDPAAFEPADQDAWHDLARTVALRTGDRDWLMALRDYRAEFSSIDTHRVLLAGGLLEEGRIEDARAELARIEDLEAVNVRDRRRAYALQARIARLENDTPAERAAIENIVHELQYWPTQSCQRCHNNAAYPDQAPLLDVRTAWYARRFVALMIEQGDADRVREEAAAQIADDPANTDARLRLAYASAALGLNDQADEHFAIIEWMKMPGRAGGPPRMMFPYP
ncbi:MAG: hypothetical protein R3B68_03635 [Phycisphaerales bacterium]